MSKPNPALRITESLKTEVKRRIFGENIPRIKKCLDLITEEQTWKRPNSELISIGNLVLHLCGNVRQWAISGIGGEPDVRDRDWEFEERGPLPKEQLLSLLDQLEQDLTIVIDNVDPETLLKPIGVQGFEENGLSILVHITEHFSYHVGQIGWFVKLIKEIDLGYYAGIDLNAKG